MQRVYVFTSNNGDGSSSVCYTRDPDLLDQLESDDPETYGMNEGSATELTFPDDLDLDTCGFDFMTGEEE